MGKLIEINLLTSKKNLEKAILKEIVLILI